MITYKALKHYIIFAIICFVILFTSVHSIAQADEAIRIHLIGDSTMSDKPGSSNENPERGWGQMLPLFFTDDVVILNHAVNGRSTKSFINEGLWEKVLSQLKPNDYVVIQFGHNDQKYKDAKRYTNPWSSYRINLQKFIDDAISKQAIPIICSSIVRRKFNDYGTLVDTHGAYPFIARSVANENKIPFIDMQWLTENYVNKLGLEKSKKTYLWFEPQEHVRYPEGIKDNTHLSIKGATAFAELFVKEVVKFNIGLSSSVK